jgi:hypothetical protein
MNERRFPDAGTTRDAQDLPGSERQIEVTQNRARVTGQTNRQPSHRQVVAAAVIPQPWSGHPKSVTRRHCDVNDAEISNREF